MTDIAIRADHTTDLAVGSDQAIERLAEWARVADAAYGIATKLCGTSFSPQAYRGKPEEATAAILAGAELGLGPMAALRAFDNIQGVPAPKAMTLRAIVQSKGHEVKVLESSPERAVVAGRAKGDEDWQTSTWTIERAKQMGLLEKNPQYKKQPANMLVARATAEVCRWIASDAIMGMPYAAEELDDEPAAARPRPMRVTAAEILSTHTEPHPDGVDGPVDPERLSLLASLFRAKGITDADDGLALMSEVAGRTITGSRELTEYEADRVIARLRELPDEQPADGDEWPAPAEVGGES